MVVLHHYNGVSKQRPYALPGFFEQPILNSPYERPRRHWELDEGRPTHRIVENRREASFITPIPKPRRLQRGQRQLALDEAAAEVDTANQQYQHAHVINGVRQQVAAWRELPERQWKVTPETARLLKHWRHHPFAGIRPFFCQVEAAETAIWLMEVAPKLGRQARSFLDHLQAANDGADPGLSRLALKLATGTGKTTVMAMLIAWQTVNAVRRPNSPRFTRGFLVATPGITIRDRLRVLLPNDPESYYASRELVPTDMLADLGRAEIFITNFHAFMRRERVQMSKGTRRLLQGQGPGQEPATLETEGQMLQRVCGKLMGMKNVLVFNDEGHHCYAAKPEELSEEGALKGEERGEAQKNKEAARMWIGGLHVLQSKLGVSRVIDLSATPFFLRGSGYAEGTLFPWTMTDFSLMDAIECGIVKLPRVPVADNVPSGEMPKFRELWAHIGKRMPGAGTRKRSLDPLALPAELQTALEALYGHYEKTFEAWRDAGVRVPPCFIVVCNNQATSKLLYDYISGFLVAGESGEDGEAGAPRLEQGRLPLFRNFDEQGQPLARPNTLLIDSERLESGEALDAKFRAMAADEIERFRHERVERTRDLASGEKISDQDLLREVMNTVGKEGALGGSIRCVVSVSMLTEGWDANTVTHVLGVRAFGTQLLCEQVVGRALRRQSYELNEDGLFGVEYADVLGIPFHFTAEPVVVKPRPVARPVHIKAVRPDRDACEIVFPRVVGYRVELPEEQVRARFDDDSTLVLTPELVGPSITRNEGIVGEGVDLTLERLNAYRHNTIAYHLTKRLMETKWRAPGEPPKLHLFGQLKAIVLHWLATHLVCKGDTRPAQLLYLALADMACERIASAIVAQHVGEKPILATLDPFNPQGTSADVSFRTAKKTIWHTDARRCHVDAAVCDSDWEMELCRLLESHPNVLAYVANQGLGFAVPYRMGGEARTYVPDFIVRVDDGHGANDPLNLVVEVKGYRREDAKAKKQTMETYWVPAVNQLGNFGCWAFVELKDVYTMRGDVDAALATDFGKRLAPLLSRSG